MRPSAAFAILLVVGVLAGCTKAPADDVRDSFDDASVRIANRLEGTNATATGIAGIPADTERLVVRTHVQVEGYAKLTLEDPSGETRRVDEIWRSGTYRNNAWFTAQEPEAGAWTLRVEANGSATYSVGFYR